MSDNNVLARHSAPSSAAGFDFQFQRALLELIYAKNGDVVGIETLDDVAVVGADGVQSRTSSQRMMREVCMGTRRTIC